MDDNMDNSTSELKLDDKDEYEVKETDIAQVLKLHTSIPKIWPIIVAKKFPFVGVANFRDLGRLYNSKIYNYLMKDNEYEERVVNVKEFQVYRSAVPLSATEKDVEIFRQMRIKTFIDLRSTREVEAQPFPPSISKFANYHKLNFLSTVKAQLKILTSASKIGASYRLIKSQLTKKEKKESLQYFADTVNQFKLYKIIAIECGYKIATALKLIAEPTNRPVVFFCSHGRDRTGIVAAMILHCLNVPKDLICSEYFLSEEGGFDEQIEIKGLKGFCRDTMWLLLNWLENKYGSLPLYLKEMGFGYTWQARLRNTLISDYSQVLESQIVPQKIKSTSFLRDIDRQQFRSFTVGDNNMINNFNNYQSNSNVEESPFPNVPFKVVPHNIMMENKPSIDVSPSGSSISLTGESEEKSKIDTAPLFNNLPQQNIEKEEKGGGKVDQFKRGHRKGSASLDFHRNINREEGGGYREGREKSHFPFFHHNVEQRPTEHKKHDFMNRIKINIMGENDHHHGEEDRSSPRKKDQQLIEQFANQMKSEIQQQKLQNEQPQIYPQQPQSQIYPQQQPQSQIYSQQQPQSYLSTQPQKQVGDQDKLSPKKSIITNSPLVSPSMEEKSYPKVSSKGEKLSRKEKKELKKINKSLSSLSNAKYLQPEDLYRRDNSNEISKSNSNSINLVIPKSPQVQRKEALKTLKKYEKECEYKAKLINEKQELCDKKFLEMKKLELEISQLQKAISQEKVSLAQTETSLLKQLQLTIQFDAPVTPEVNTERTFIVDSPLTSTEAKRNMLKRSGSLNPELFKMSNKNFNIEKLKEDK